MITKIKCFATPDVKKKYTKLAGAKYVEAANKYAAACFEEAPVQILNSLRNECRDAFDRFITMVRTPLR